MGNEEERFARNNCKTSDKSLSWSQDDSLSGSVGSELSQKFWVKVGVLQRIVLSLLLFAIVEDAIMEIAKGLMNEIVYADDLVLMSESMENLREKFLK